ncbi:VOC family protein (plasmid) [Bradyrhizobium barranii subsp. apii]|uniref:VOC family protein n=1 Tax=Bradyrhizobium barranii subsp. apii TaxID=2819348 RepID=A0A8T5VJV4_9BRAD|nr:VOC family protein [Bradyrhizobium barranii]UPT92447.1 VOC family protein [Bradyrhizobium barranii subsp. apii]
MNFPAINLVVLRSDDPANLAAFYEGLGMHFEMERHGDGREHLASTGNGVVFEIYPRRGDEPISRGVRLGFRVRSISEVLERLGPRAHLLSDRREVLHLRSSANPIFGPNCCV